MCTRDYSKYSSNYHLLFAPAETKNISKVILNLNLKFSYFLEYYFERSINKVNNLFIVEVDKSLRRSILSAIYLKGLNGTNLVILNKSKQYYDFLTFI